MARIILVTALLFVAIYSANGLTLRTTPKPQYKIFKDGQMDEGNNAEEEPVPVPVTVKSSNQRTQSKAVPITVAPAPETDSGVATYKLPNRDGSACILFQVDALLIYKFKTVHNEEDEKDKFIPNDAAVSGDCGKGDKANIGLNWQDFTLTTSFAKTPGGARWYIDKVDLFINTDNNKVFEHIKTPGQKIHLTTTADTQLYPTPVGKSFSCAAEELSIELTSKYDVRATLLLRTLRIQPFIFRNGEFGPEFICSRGGTSFRDETAPIAVGSTLAIVVLCTVTGYGIFRYFKIKKVQYDTME